jgi:phage major head subunit gpT-like protein
MPLTRSDIPNLLLPGLKTLFMQEFQGVGVDNMDYATICSIIQSNKDQEKYGWLGSVPAMREFVGERQLKSLIESDYSLENKTWESTLEVSRTAIEDDQYGQIQLRTRGLAQEAARHKSEILWKAVAAGATTGVCYDGASYFSTAHTTTGAEYATAQSNMTTTALSAGALQAAITAIAIAKDDRGRPMGGIADTLAVPPQLQWTARELLESDTDPSTATNTKKNVLKGSLNLIVTPYFPETDWWFVFDTKHAVKPMIMQERTAVDMEALESNSESGFMRDLYLYGIRARYAVGYGMWQYAYAGIV